MRNENVWERLALGAIAGLAGTVVIQTLLKTHQKYSPQSLPPMREEPGRFMIRKAKQALPEKLRARVPEKAEAISAKLLGIGYGVTFGALYAIARPKTKRALLEGAVLGMAAWAAGYLGWLPGAKLMPPVWKHKAKQIIPPLVEHSAFGIATVGAYRLMRKRIGV